MRQDAVAGVPGAIASVPDGMASAVLVGVNPVYGLYASMAGPIGGGLAVSTRLMVVTTTTAAALAAGSALERFLPVRTVPSALFVLSVLAGVMMILAGVVPLGALHAVCLGVGADRIPHGGRRQHRASARFGDLLGSPGRRGKPAAVKAFNVVTHPERDGR